MTKDETLLKHRLQDLANMADRRGVFTFTDFLGLYEQSILEQLNRELSFVRQVSFGGFAEAERKMTAFIPCFAEGDTPAFPISCLCLTSKLKGEKLSFTHRDVLGTVLGLGLDRGRIGDILVGEEETLMLCHASNASFLCEELTRIRHTPVRVSQRPLSEIHYTPKTKAIMDSVASERLDSVVAAAFGLSRSDAMALIRREYVFINGKCTPQPAAHLRAGDVLSARGYGKAKYVGAEGETKKGRIRIHIEKYI